MIIQCPKCSQRYYLNDALLGLKGRLVVCGQCHYRWKQVPFSKSSHVVIPDVHQAPTARTSTPLLPHKTTSLALPKPSSTSQKSILKPLLITFFIFFVVFASKIYGKKLWSSLTSIFHTLSKSLT